MPAFDPSLLGIFLFGLVAGICPCNSVLCLGLIGYLTSGTANLSLANILKLVLAFTLGTILVLLPLGLVAGFLGHYLLFLNSTIAWCIGGVLLILMGFQLLHLYKPPIKSVISSVGGAVGKKIKEKANVSGEVADRVIGIAIIVIGVYFLYLAFG